ncbi:MULTISPECIES: hypothetical protein [Bacillus cereus group]|uniref:hypothetical protein n=1 Tax=Bacillus cereus group TaxID=86661 RepID=UPI000D8A8BB2|nr:hypothetical protein [Bacillus cereus]MCU4948846.1 hypothetical protein [Bacillus cereus]SPT76092.1 Zinc metalloproteinase [Bacillus cereus]
MKCKTGIQVKNDFKKSLFVTAATMTLGMSTFGGPVSVFAAEYVIPIVDSKTLEQSPEDSQERIKKQNETREYFKNIPQKTLTVLIAADKQYRDAHSDWKERTKVLIENGTKDFKEYYNIKYVPIQFFEWDSKGENRSDIMYNFADDYTKYITDNPNLSSSFGLVIGFTANKDYGSAYGGMLPQTVGLEEGESIPLVTIKDVPNDNKICSIESTIKHELSHTYSVPDDYKWGRNSVMSSKVGVTEWSSAEMEIISKNRDRYQNHKI